METYDLSIEEAEYFLLFPKTVLIYSLLRCAPCEQLKRELDMIPSNVAPGWRFGICTVFGRSLLRLKETRNPRGFPTIMIHDGRSPPREFRLGESPELGNSTASCLIRTIEQELGLTATVTE